jgi:nucleoside phosphorylase
MSTFPSSDIAIVTGLGRELDSVLQAFPELVAQPTTPTGYVFYKGRVPVKGSLASYDVIASTAELAGPAPAQNLGKEVMEWKPSLVFLVGIAAAAGTPYGKEYRKGDILISTNILNYMNAIELRSADAADLATAIEEGDVGPTEVPLRIKWNVVPTSEALVRLCCSLSRTVSDWPTRIPCPRPHADDETHTQPQIYPGVVASGPILAKGDRLMRFFLRLRNDVVGLEMEAAGCAQAFTSAFGAVRPDDFCVIKCASDYGVHKDDAWHEYAKAAAATFCSEVIRSGLLPLGRELHRRRIDLRGYRAAVMQWSLDALPQGRRFSVPLKRYRSMDELLTAPDHGELVNDFAQLVIDSSRPLIMHGAGGVGKSAILHRLAVDLVQRDVTPVLVDIRELVRQEVDLDDTARIDYESLFRRLLLAASPQPIGLNDFERLPGQIVLILDAFNEATTRHGESVQDRLFASLTLVQAKFPALKILIADRFNPRPQAARYVRLSAQRMDSTFVATVIADYADLPPSTQEFLRLPFFLNLWLRRHRSPTEASTKADMLKAALSDVARMTDEEICRLAAVAYEAYKHGSEYFDAQLVGLTRQRLIDAGFLTVKASGTHAQASRPEDARFSHQLFHDYLAGRHVAAGAVDWSEDAFDILSLKRNSFEPVQVALEEVDVARRVDFLTRVYDWSYIAAAVSLAEGQLFAVTEGIPEEIRTAIVASIAEKQFDLFPHSRDAAARTLRQLPESMRRGYLVEPEGGTEMEMRSRVAGLESPVSWFLRWRSIFCTPGGARPQREHLRAVADENSLIGWAGANLLRRSKLDGDGWFYLMGTLDGFADRKTDRSKRWRIAHVFGTTDRMDVVEELLRLIQTDEYHWVKYGATRSVIEAAWQNATLREPVFERITAVIEHLTPLCRYEVARCLLIGKGDQEWLGFADSLIGILSNRYGDDPGLEWSKVRTEIRQTQLGV